MHALLTTGLGGLTISAVEEIHPGPGEVLVDFIAGTVNPVDVMVVEGFSHNLGLVPAGTAVGLGWDFVGTVASVGEDVDLTVGTLVAGVVAGIASPRGALAERVVAPAEDLASIPDGLDPVAAATIGMNALTAAQILELLGPAQGRSLLITGAAGAVGGLTLELAQHSGWNVTGLARSSDAAFVTKFGAELITELVPGRRTFDAVVDAAPLQLDHERFATLVVPALAEGGAFVGVLGVQPPPDVPGAKVAVANVRADGAGLARLLDMAVRGHITTRVARTWPFAEASAAFDAVSSGGQRGRQVVIADRHVSN